MSVAVKNLAFGTLASTTLEGTGGPDEGKSWIVKSIMVTNQDTSSRAVDIKFLSGSTPAYLAPPGLTLGAKSTFIVDNEITLQYPTSGTQEKVSIAVGTTPSTGVDYVLNGVERDIA